MDLVTPSIGLVFWTTLTFIFLILLLGKFAWRPIVSALNERERSIEDALSAADKAKEELTRLNQESDKLLKDARLERDKILKEAKTFGDNLIAEAKHNAQTEGAKMIAKAHDEINAQKNAALAEVKNQVATLSIEIAEKVLRKKFENAGEQQTLVAELLKDVKLN
ncbi:F0F1 ATP synthase subunit B [Solitalea sp. MAHUQ-68]|uniref:ATP synthase subunit b n=1 Tax=Solitalea agri TaxID=2953739 RepID=A0A9X2JCI4_9SPHI|nr:F0F1 ATP synthase subunit B [Solitalea agri]MCO4293512.1 F0F1 ATP synthase subunit B [Solitalea agri]